MKLDAPIALGLALLTAARFLSGCLTATEQQFLSAEARLCAEYVRPEGLDPSVDALICKGIEAGSAAALVAAANAAARSTPTAAPSPVKVPVADAKGNHILVPAHLEAGTRAALGGGDAGADR